MAVAEFCFHCGEHVDGSWRFCRECGAGVDVAPVATRSAFCTECGMGLAESWRFCVRCGTSTPVARKARSVHLSPQEAARWAGVAAPGTSEISGSETPSVELISRTYDVIDLRPVEESLPASGRPVEPAVGVDATGAAVETERRVAKRRDPDLPDRAEDDEQETVASTNEAVVEPAESGPVDDGGEVAPEAERPDEDTPYTIDAPARVEAPQALVTPRDDRSASAPGRLRDRVASMDRIRVAGSRSAALPRPAAPGVVSEEDIHVPVAISRFRDPAPVGQMAQLAFLAVGSVAIAAVVALVILNNRLEEFGVAVEGEYARVETAQRVVDTWLRPVLVALGVGALALFAVWGHRVYANLTAFGKQDLRLPTHAALWSWIVPIVNLVIPRRLIDDAWRGSDVYAFTDPDWKARPGNAWLRTAWWAGGAFIVFTIIGQFVGAATVEKAMDANAWAMLGYGALIVCCLAAVRTIAAITDRQDTRARGLLGKV